MKKSLLDVVIIHHSSDGVSGPYVTALQRSFEYVRLDVAVSQFAVLEDPWERVFVAACSDPEELLKLLARPDTPTLYVVLITDKLVESAEFANGLNLLADTLPKAEGGSRTALCYSFSATAIGSLPVRLRSRQVKDVAALGEHQIGPHRLALLALHRARLLLGDYAAPGNLNSADRGNLQFFISHAKADGVFFAKALKDSIDDVPELKTFYDAADIESGSDWANTLDDAASRCVFIALRTPIYDQRRVCREEFETALLHGLPIVVVDAMSMQPVSSPSYLPFSAMPTVRIADGNTHRVVMAALREHLRVLLMQAIVREKTVDYTEMKCRVWPRFPCVSALTSKIKVSECWLVPQSLIFEAEFLATRDWLKSVGASLQLEILEQFRPSGRLIAQLDTPT